MHKYTKNLYAALYLRSNFILNWKLLKESYDAIFKDHYFVYLV